LPVEEVAQLEDSPHEDKAFAVHCGVIVLCNSESSAPVSDRMKHFTRFCHEEGTPDMIGARVHIDSELPIVL